MSQLHQLGRLYSTFAVQIEEFGQHCSEWDTPELRDSRRVYQKNNIGLALGLKQGEIRCVIVPYKGSGKYMTSVFQENSLEGVTETTLRFRITPIGRVPYIVIWNSAISGANRLATKLLGIEVTGPVTFILLDHNYRPTHMDASSFKLFMVSQL